MMEWVTLAVALAGPASATEAEGQQLDVVTWNAWGLPSPIAQKRKARLPQIADWLDAEGYDVVGLQEVWRGARGLLARVRPYLPAADGDSGLALVTRHPLRELELHPYEAARGVDAWKAKGVLEAEVEIDGAPVHVAVTHLQAGGSARSATVRAAQIDQMLSWITADGDDRPTVLMGDFNLYDGQEADEASLQRLHDAGFVDAVAAVGEHRGTYPGVSHRFDRIFVRGAVSPSAAAVLEEAAPLSDHLPVSATVALTE